MQIHYAFQKGNFSLRGVSAVGLSTAVYAVQFRGDLITSVPKSLISATSFLETPTQTPLSHLKEEGEEMRKFQNLIKTKIQDKSDSEFMLVIDHLDSFQRPEIDYFLTLRHVVARYEPKKDRLELYFIQGDVPKT